MKRHGETATQRPQSQRVNLRVDEILQRVPAQGPPEAAEVDHDNGAPGGVLLARRLRDRLVGYAGVDEEEDGHVEHGEELDGDSRGQGALAADEVDEDEGAEDRGEEFHEAEDGGREELFALAACAPGVGVSNCFFGGGNNGSR